MSRLTRNKMIALAVAALGMGMSACAAEPTSTSTERIRRLTDADHDRLLEEVGPTDGTNLILPMPGDCPVMAYTETHTVIVDEAGNIISETYSVCTQCFEEDGVTPIGEAVCYEEPPMPVDVICEEYDSGDPTLGCYICYEPDGTVVVDECWPLPVECASDAECPEGQICYLYETWIDEDGDGLPDGGGGMDPGEPPMGGGGTIVVGYCGFPDPCVAVDSLPSDPTGTSCWQCTDPATGEDWGSWCDVHTCNDDGTCANPWEVCDAASGLCIWDDPCDPVADGSLPGDPTGSDCYSCIDPATGEDWGGWCNVHSCDSDAECAPFGLTCNADGLCEWVDPCVPVPYLDSDPTGLDCYSCSDPMSGDWGYCVCHTCTTDADCTTTGFGTECGADGVCAGD